MEEEERKINCSFFLELKDIQVFENITSIWCCCGARLVPYIKADIRGKKFNANQCLIPVQAGIAAPNRQSTKHPACIEYGTRSHEKEVFVPPLLKLLEK